MSKLTPSTVLVCTLLIVVLTGCSTSPPTRLYLIEPMAAIPSANVDTELTITVGPITLPEHLNRKEILTHDQPYRVSTAEFDRWAEPLDHNITAALAENLSMLVPTDHVIAYPWDAARRVDYTVRVRVIAFGTDPSGEVVLSASWMIHDTVGAPVTLSKARYSESRRGNDVVATVAAMSRAIEQLSRDIANALHVASAESAARPTNLAEGHRQ